MEIGRGGRKMWEMIFWVLGIFRVGERRGSLVIRWEFIFSLREWEMVWGLFVRRREGVVGELGLIFFKVLV